MVPFLTLAPGLMKGLLGLSQLGTDVKRVDTTPLAFKEALDNGRQDAMMTAAPGMAAMQTNLAKAQSTAVNNAMRVGASSGDVLAANASAQAQRQTGEERLAAETERQRLAGKQALRGLLSKQAEYNVADDNRYNQAVAAMKGGGLTNLFGGLTDAATAVVGAKNGYATDTDPTAYNPRFRNIPSRPAPVYTGAWG